MKLLMDLYKQMDVKMESQTFSFKSSETQDRKATEALEVKQEIGEYAQKETISYIESKIKVEDSQPRDSYIVSGSVFGWNFITFRGGAPVYYGVTKESFRILKASTSSQRAESPK
ncbi:hypothetical protein M5689_017846 [Euphorbia peplus]|nr:hypothetical protein M5689_017846 [Euphorbia peplus]